MFHRQALATSKRAAQPLESRVRKRSSESASPGALAVSMPVAEAFRDPTSATEAVSRTAPFTKTAGGAGRVCSSAALGKLRRPA
jgi:hypothetical protein